MLRHSLWKRLTLCFCLALNVSVTPTSIPGDLLLQRHYTPGAFDYSRCPVVGSGFLCQHQSE